MKSKKKALTPEKKLSQALLPREEWPYELPKGWVWTYMGNIAEWGSGGTPSRKHPEYYSGEIPWIKTGELNDSFIYDTSEKITEEAVSRSSAKIYPQNTVMIAMYGATIGKTGIMGVEAATNQACACAKVFPFVCFKYLFYYLISKKSYFINSGKGGAQPNISQDFLKRFYFPLPSLSEQQRIVNKIESLFAKLDEAGDRLQKVLDGYEARRAAILHEAFSGKWTGDHGAGDKSVPKGWRKVKLSDVCTINPKKLNTTSLEDSLEVSFVPMASVDEVLGEVTKLEIRNLGKVKKGFTNFQEGDVVFAKITPCMENGKSAVIGPLLNDIGYGTTEFYVLRCHPELYNRFLYHLVRSIKFRSDAKSQMTGAVGQQRVPKNFMADYEILLPPLDEQIQIVQMVDTFFKKEYEVRKMSQNVIDQIDLMKKSILARAFRGELGTQDPSDPSALELLRECVMASEEDSKS